MSNYLQELHRLVGVASPASVAHYPVSEAMIHHWCDALGDHNPVYTDRATAVAVGHDGVVAPPTMLQAWTMPGLKPWQENPAGNLLVILEEAGFAGVVATNCEQEYFRYLQPGDTVSSSQVLESVSDLKKTALGTGHFVAQLWTYRDAAGHVVGTMRFSMLFFRPEGTVAPVNQDPPAHPGVLPDTAVSSASAQGVREVFRPSRSFASVEVGEELDELGIDITRTLIVSAAIASRDYQDVHHDPDRARKKGSPDIFMNILSTNGFVGRYVTDWFGPASRIKSVKIRLGVPNYPGDRMVMSGRVDRVAEDTGEVDIAVRGANNLGDHVVGSVRIALPKEVS